MPAVPASIPTSAPVLDFVCLFTHDLKRKQKRWQDGRLKFHSFNRRVMVYDERGNFIGDTHWCADYDLEDGEELELDRGGVIVQVAECVGQRDQDLTEVFAKKPKQKEQPTRALQSLAMSQAQTKSRLRPAPDSGQKAAASRFQLRHVPVQSLLSSPKGPVGRAVIPTESPYEERQQVRQQAFQARDDSGPPGKRRKNDLHSSNKSCYARSLFGEPITLSAQPTSSPLMLHQESGQERNRRSTSVGQDGGDSAASRAKPVSPSTPESLAVPRQPGSSYREMRRVSNSPGRHSKPPSRPPGTLIAQGQGSGGDDSTLELAVPRSRGLEPLPRKQHRAQPRPKKPGPMEARGGGKSSPPPCNKENYITEKRAETTPRSPSKRKRRKVDIATHQVPFEPLGGKLKEITTMVPKGPEGPEGPDQDEPMTELRIGSRKRRGLLLVSEKKAGPPAPENVARTSSLLSKRGSRPGSDTSGLSNVKAPGVAHQFYGQNPNKSPRHRPCRQHAIETVALPTVNPEPPVPQGPRGETAETAETAEMARTATDGQGPSGLQKIKNPATRGKKAAKEPDAAGQVPQAMAGLDPIAEDTSRVRTLGKAEARKPLQGTARNSAEASSCLPGFSKADGRPWFQPWSKHAYDLLGEGRPAKNSK